MTQANEQLVQQIHHHLAGHPERVSSLELDGQRYWIKRQEKMPLIRRIQKGDPQAALRQECEALIELAEKNLPVVEMVASGEDFIAVKDCGVSINQFLHSETMDQSECTKIFSAAGAALAGLHNAGVSHGRPSLRDICWQDGKITFIDFERYSRKRNSLKGHRNDLIMFVFNAHVVSRGSDEFIKAAFEGYREKDQNDVWQLAQRWCRNMKWITYITNPIYKWRKSRELRAVSFTFRTFLDYVANPNSNPT